MNQLVWPEKFARVSFKDMCDKLNGNMPSITDQGNLFRSIENKTLRSKALEYKVGRPIWIAREGGEYQKRFRQSVSA